MKKHDFFDTSRELLIQRWKNGVRLIKPDDFHQAMSEGMPAFLPTISVNDLFTTPLNVYFLNKKSVMLSVSEKVATTLGFEECKEVEGSTVFDVLKQESAKLVVDHDHKVLSHQSIIFQEQLIVRLDDFNLRGIEVKFPLFNDEGQLIGILGFTVFPEQAPESFNALMSTGLLAMPVLPQSQMNDSPLRLSTKITSQEINTLMIQLSEKFKQPILKREVECLFYLIRGKSARETGVALNLSQRTIEFYLESLKDKLDCKKKSEIIEKVLAR